MQVVKLYTCESAVFYKFSQRQGVYCQSRPQNEGNKNKE